MSTRRRGIATSSGIRVLMTGPTPPPRNGMSVTTANLRVGLAGTGIELHLVDTADRRGLRNVGRLDAGDVAKALLHGCRFGIALFRLDPDVVYVPIAQSALGFVRDSLFLLPARLRRKKVVVHLHGCSFRAFYREAPAPIRLLVRACLRDVSCAVVLGHPARTQFEGLIDASRVRVVENGVPDASIEMDNTVGPRLSQGHGVVLFLSSLAVGKGFLDLLRAIPALDDLPGLRFVFAGEYRTAEAQAEAERLIDEHRLRSRIDVLGAVDAEHAQRLLRRAGVLVLPVRQVEGQPLVLLEAFSCGTPVVASPSGCIPDTVSDEHDGLLVAAGRPDALAAAIRRLSTDARLWSNMAQAARRTYEERFTLDRWGESMARVFIDVTRNMP